VDQTKEVLRKLKRNPEDARMIVSAWHPYWLLPMRFALAIFISPTNHCFLKEQQEIILKDKLYSNMQMSGRDLVLFYAYNKVPLKKIKSSTLSKKLRDLF